MTHPSKSPPNGKKRYRVAVLGATGAVGREILALLDERRFPLERLHALASEKIPGRQVSFGEEKVLTVEATETFDFSQVDMVLASPGEEISKLYAPKAAAAGAVYIDNSSAFRLDPEIPLVVPEVNLETLGLYKNKNIIASPNCVAIPLAIFLKPLQKAVPIKRVVISTYQSVSGAGQAALSELMTQTKGVLMGTASRSEYLPRQIAFNIFPHVGDFTEGGHTTEELKIIQETQKMLSLPLPISVTSVRVPTFIGHALSVVVEFEGALSVAQARQILKKAPGITLRDNREREDYVVPIDCVKQDDVFVSRLRQDPSCANGLMAWVVTDNLRKGAALNTVQIAEKLKIYLQ